MILINAGITLYYADHFDQSDQDIKDNVNQVRQLALSNAKIIHDLTQERNVRADQTCELFETDHLQKVQSLRQRYQYLTQLTPEELTQPLNRFIIIALPQVEQEAVIDRAPEYCDGTKPNGDDIGLPEPDPKIPDRPKKLVQLIGKRPNYPTVAEVAREGKKLTKIQKQKIKPK